MQRKSTKKVFLLEHSLAHYRQDVFDSLLNCQDFNFEILSTTNYKGIKSAVGNFKIFKHKKLQLLSHQFFYYVGMFKYVFKNKPDIIICCGFDPHLLHTLLIFFYHRILKRKKFYWWSHGTFGKQGYIGFLFRKFFYFKASGVFVYSKKGKDNLVLMGINERDIEIVNNSINNNEYGYLNYNLLDNKQKDRDTLKILFCGRITPEKKIDVLINSLKIIKDENKLKIKAVIIGGGDITNLTDLVKKHGLESNIEFVGSKHGVETYEYFLNSDIFVYPGGIGLSLLQAFSFGLPVLTSNNVEIHGPEIELLKNDYNGDFCTDNDPADFARKINKWHDLIIKHKIEIQNNCIKSIEDNNYKPSFQYETIIKSLLSKE